MKNPISILTALIVAAPFYAFGADALCVAKIESGIVARVESINPKAIPYATDAALVAFMQSLYGAETEWRQCFADGSKRKQYPGPGYAYDAVSDKFIAPQPFPSWSLNADKDWVAPVVMPDDGKSYRWDEETKSWSEIK